MFENGLPFNVKQHFPGKSRRAHSCLNDCSDRSHVLSKTGKTRVCDWPFEHVIYRPSIKTCLDKRKDLINLGEILFYMSISMRIAHIHRKTRKKSALQHLLSEQCLQFLFVFVIERKSHKRHGPHGRDIKSILLRECIPAHFDLSPNTLKVCGNLFFFHLFDCRKRSNKTHAFSPVGTTHECLLCNIHNSLTTNDRSHRIAVAHRLSKHRNIRQHAKLHMHTAEVRAEPRRYLIKNKDGVILCREHTNFFQETISGLLMTHRLHDDDSNVALLEYHLERSNT